MPKFNSRGDIVYGQEYVGFILGGQNHQINNSNQGCWLNDDNIIFQTNLNLGTPYIAKQFVGTPGFTSFYSSPVTQLDANNGLWAAFLAGSGIVNLNLPLASSPSCGTDVIAYRTNGAVGGITIGSNVFPNENPNGISCIDSKATAWFPGNGPYVRFFDGNTITQYNTFKTIPNGKIFRVGNVIWIMYNGDRLYIHPITDCTKGYTIEGNTYGPDVLNIGNNYLLVCSSTSAAELYQDIQTTLISLSSPMESF